ncbi:MAG: EAL domain-containing protein [Gammaproteobacteria bacterium]|nr:EAL domain-containing protein [Gammaproteobacteria bacterium]
MSAQLSQHVTTRLLIAEKSENAAYELDSALRDAGIATKLTISDDLAHIAQITSQGETDIVLLTYKIDGLEKLLPRIRAGAPHTPVVLLTSPQDPEPKTSENASANEAQQWTIASALAIGATDVVPVNCPEQLALVVKRELENVCQRQQYSQVRRALKEAEQRCQLLLQGSKAAIAYVHEGMHIHANEGYLNLFGYSDIDDLCAVSLIDILSADSSQELKTQLKRLRSGTNETEFDFENNVENSAAFSGSMTLTHSQYEGEDCLQITVRRHNGSGTKTATQTYGDAVATVSTELELPGFAKAAETLFSTSTDENYLLCIGIDHFSQMQSAYGLIGSEAICRKVWQKLEELSSEYPLVRLSNKQFALALTAASYDLALQTADQIRTDVSELILEIQDKTVRPTISIAGAAFNGDAGVSASLDEAFGYLMDLAEQASSNTVSIPTDDVETEESDNARIILKQITNAIEKKMFVVLFQPVISLRGDSDEHYEVFLRMTDDQGQQIEPGRFLQTAIDNNVAGKIDRWVILQSIKMLSVHRAKGHTTRLTINLTANSVMDPEFLQWLTVAIKAARLPSDAVIFQITEKDATTYLRQTREFIEGLRAMHCRASLSRFGLIDDPFETLRHLPVDMVKLDGTVVNPSEDSEKSREVMMGFINKLQSAGKLTVIPMVENAGMLSMLWQAGANYIQGHYLQEPTTMMDYDFNTED